MGETPKKTVIDHWYKILRSKATKVRLPHQRVNFFSLKVSAFNTGDVPARDSAHKCALVLPMDRPRALKLTGCHS
jgi:hypothetical protein